MGKRKKIYLVITCILLTSTLTMSVYFINQNPLVIGGVTEYNNGENYDIELVNTGFRNIKLTKVVSGNQKLDDAELVFSYTEQLVAGGIDSSPQAKFLRLSDGHIRPRMSVKDQQKAIKAGNIPVHYGIRLNNKETTLLSVIIHYRYFGMTFKREVILKQIE